MATSRSDLAWLVLALCLLAPIGFPMPHPLWRIVLVGALANAVAFANPFWKLLVAAIAHAALAILDVPGVPAWLEFVLIAAVLRAPHLLSGSDQPAEGVVFVTGCDSGMGFHTAARLVQKGYVVVAGAFLEDSEPKLREAAGLPKSGGGGKDKDHHSDRLVVVRLDVTSDASVEAAREATEAAVRAYRERNEGGAGLVGVVNCAGVGYHGPAEYFPLELYKKQFEVNAFGYIRVAQAFLPMLKDSANRKGARRGRLVFFGTGGGVCSPAPPLLSAYMASKFAVEAYCSCLRLELQLAKQPVDCCMVNPGFIKPTGLMAGGLRLAEAMWAACEKRLGDGRARDQYEKFYKKFVQFSEEQPGTHVSVVADVMERVMAASRPLTSYKVGPDSVAAPFVGMLPTGVREFIVKKNMMGETGAV
eukprot:g1427.t1